MRPDTSTSEALNAIPASTVAMSRSISSGSSLSTCLRRAFPRDLMTTAGSCQPAAAKATMSTKVSNDTPPVMAANRATMVARKIAANAR